MFLGLGKSVVEGGVSTRSVCDVARVGIAGDHMVLWPRSMDESPSK